jgi:TRAP-type C4-dicarboxylate transport system substrate-binding protein
MAFAETKLKWAHVYEASEAYHTCAVAADELLMTATDGRFGIEVFPASSLGKEVDINEGLGFGTVVRWAVLWPHRNRWRAVHVP